MAEISAQTKREMERGRERVFHARTMSNYRERRLPYVKHMRALANGQSFTNERGLIDYLTAEECARLAKVADALELWILAY